MPDADGKYTAPDGEPRLTAQIAADGKDAITVAAKACFAAHRYGHPWDDADPVLRLGYIADAAEAYAAMEPLIRRQVAEEVAAELLARGRDPHQNLAWMYPDQAAAIAREIGERHA